MQPRLFSSELQFVSTIAKLFHLKQFAGTICVRDINNSVMYVLHEINSSELASTGSQE